MNEPGAQAARQASVDLLHVALNVEDTEAARRLVKVLHPSEVADFIERLPARQRGDVWALLDPTQEGAVLAHMQDTVRADVLEQMCPADVADATRALAADDVADILQDPPDEVADTILQAMDAQNRQRLADVLTYPEDTAGGLMDTDVVPVRADVSLDVVARYLRRLGQIPDKTDNLMVVRCSAIPGRRIVHRVLGGHVPCLNRGRTRPVCSH